MAGRGFPSRFLFSPFFCLVLSIGERNGERRTITRPPLAAFIRIVARYYSYKASAPLLKCSSINAIDARRRIANDCVKCEINYPREWDNCSDYSYQCSPRLRGSISLFPCFVCGCTDCAVYRLILKDSSGGCVRAWCAGLLREIKIY